MPGAPALIWIDPQMVHGAWGCSQLLPQTGYIERQVRGAFARERVMAGGAGRAMRLGVAASAVAIAVMLGGSAQAHTRGFLSFGFGFPIYAGPPAYYYPPPAYYPPPYYYRPAPPPVVYADPPVAYSAPAQTCREYQTSAYIDGRHQPLYGRVCLQPDGSWRVQP